MGDELKAAPCPVNLGDLIKEMQRLVHAIEFEESQLRLEVRRSIGEPHSLRVLMVRVRDLRYILKGIEKYYEGDRNDKRK